MKAADPLNELHAAGLAAAVQSGYRRASDISGGLEVGFGAVDLNIIDGQRQSAADAYLRPALERPNLTLLTDAVVGRLVIEHARCIGVEYRTGKLTSRALAAEVVLTAGAIGSAHLLMSSGIGPQSHLAEVGIDVQVHLPGVGANLQDHTWAMLAYRAAHPVPPGRNNHGEVDGLQISLIGAREKLAPIRPCQSADTFTREPLRYPSPAMCYPPAGQALSAIYTPQSRQFGEECRLVVRRR